MVGLGAMGIPMAARLAGAGHTVLGYDVVDEARTRLAAAGGQPVERLDALAAVDVVILMLPSSDIVTDVLLGAGPDDGLVGVLAPATLVIDMSSSEPQSTRELAGRLAEAGLRFLDAPVSGGVRGATSGNLTVMVGGSEDDVAAALPLFQLLGKPRHVGPVGAGHALKALNNLLSAVHLWATSEAMVTGQRFGLDPAVMLEAINGSSGRSGSTEVKWPSYVLPGTYDSGFALQLMVKDMRIATGLARDVGSPALLGETAVDLWARASEDLARTADHTEIARWLDDLARREEED
jgi:3-hydroxyisobutyrate dehydrogenase